MKTWASVLMLQKNLRAVQEEAERRKRCRRERFSDSDNYRYLQTFPSPHLWVLAPKAARPCGQLSETEGAELHPQGGKTPGAAWPGHSLPRSCLDALLPPAPLGFKPCSPSVTTMNRSFLQHPASSPLFSSPGHSS